MHGDLFGESLKGVLSLQLLKLDWGVLVEELVKREVATSDTDVDFILVDLHVDSLGSELVDALGLSHEHNLELLAVGIVVDILSQLLVDSIVLNGNVDSDP